MKPSSATAQAHPNIAFIKYWGNRDNILRLPSNGSISMNLDGLFTRTTVNFNSSQRDSLLINGHLVTGKGLERVSYILDIVREMAKLKERAEVSSVNNFPAGAGIASSAAAFAALAIASSQAAGLILSEQQLSRLARRGSGSASRSIPGGFVEWQVGTGDEDCVAISIAPPEHWALVDCVAIVNASHKKTGSTEGHALARTSPLQVGRVADTPRRLDICRTAILKKDFEGFGFKYVIDTIPTPVTIICGKEMLARTYRYDSLEELQNQVWFIDALMCKNSPIVLYPLPETADKVDGVIFRMFSNAPSKETK